MSSSEAYPSRMPWTTLVSGLAVLIVVASVGRLLARPEELVHGHGPTLLAFAVAIIAGETLRATLPGGRISAPISMAATLGMAFAWEVDGQPDFDAIPALQVLTVAIAMLLGAMVRRAIGLDVSPRSMGARFVSLSFAVWIAYQLLPLGAVSPGGSGVASRVPMLLSVLTMIAVGTMAALVTMVLNAALRAEQFRTKVTTAIRDESWGGLPLVMAIVASGPFTALLTPVLGLATIPFTLFPVILTLIAVRRVAANRVTYREIISTLSRMTERGGYTSVDHAERVAGLAVRVGRFLGLPERSITDLEYAALLHDIGQIALREPIPGGATLRAAPADQRHIARDGALIVRNTAVLGRVAELIEGQNALYRDVREGKAEVPIECRILKVVNAFDDLTGGQQTRVSTEEALERINLGLGYEYDPDVVDALAVVMGAGRGPAPVLVPRPPNV